MRSVELEDVMRTALLLLLCVPSAGLAENDRFRDGVAPILERQCLSCHAGAKPKGKFSLESRDDLFAKGFVVPGEPASSYLLDLVATDDGRPEMPREGRALSVDEVAVLRRWIAAGAEWPADAKLALPEVADRDWWSLRPIEARTPPATGHPVDAFLESRMRTAGVQPVVPADPRTLIRRVRYDLSGLPPTPAEVAAFEGAHARDPEAAWSAVVDRLLAAPTFGEKWGRHWLDVARYAETHGYDKDKMRPNAWPYRDYVIRSLNDDKPYDRFVREQVAGDVLYPGEPDAVTALGFLAAGPWDLIGHEEVGEGKLDGRIAKHLDRDEMVAATFNVFASTTVQCARCHPHKFDPVRMADYYRLHAVFAAVDRADRPYDGLPPERARERDRIAEQLAIAKRERDTQARRLDSAVAKRSAPVDQRIAELRRLHGTKLRPEYGYHSRIEAKQDTPKWVQIDLGQSRPIAKLRLRPCYDDYNGIGAGFGFPVRYRVQVSNDQTFGNTARTVHDVTTADQPNPACEPITIAVGGDPVRYVRLTATKLAPRSNDFIFALGEVEAFAPDSDRNLARGARVTSLDSIQAAPRWGRSNLVDGIAHVELDDAAARAELKTLRERRTAIEDELRTPDAIAQLKVARRRVADLEARMKQFPRGPVVYAAATTFKTAGRFQPTNGRPRPIHVLYRGDLRAPGEAVRPGAPPLWEGATGEFFETDDWNEAEARAALAEYLVDRDNPLVWRSIVNRLWLWTFGRGLVGTPNDFGRMGQQPTHPELLDHLAARLRDDPDHSLKSIVRLLVTSRAYRRSSAHREANAEVDADNRLLWRANRRRLTAEEFRDSLLATGGVLRLDDRGGPSFRDFVVQKPQHSPHYEYGLHDPDDTASHRRSIYRFVVRSQPQPLLTTLDCADPSLSVARRDESTTAVQALAQWNSRFVEAMSRRLGGRLEREATSKRERVELGCRLVLGRPPTARESTLLTAHLERHGAASLARVLLNLNAFVYVD